MFKLFTAIEIAIEIACGFEDNKIISFNYLDDPSNFSFYLQFFIDKNVKSPCSPPIGIKADDLAGMFVFFT